MHARGNPLHKAEVAKSAETVVRVMIVDDSLTVRTAFSRMLSSEPTLEIVATASTGEDAIRKLAVLDADVILLDLEMPGIGGLGALPKLLETNPNVQVLVVSSLTMDGGKHTLDALAMGAADTMLKPRPGGFDEAYRISLIQKVMALGSKPCALENAAGSDTEHARSFAYASSNRVGKRPEIVAFGASTGGIHALNIVLSALPDGFNLPIAITQHLPSEFVPIFARQIEESSGRKAIVAGDGVKVNRGEVIIANGDGHMEFARFDDALVTRITNTPMKSGCRPSVDPMLTSLAKTTNGRTLAVFLSGMGHDGLTGAQHLFDADGIILAQDAHTSAVWGMPGAVTKAGLVNACLPVEQIADAIVASCGAMAWK